MKILLSSSYAFVIKAQNFHWNVEGPDFPQYHEFFGELYEEVYGSIDKTAEYVRILDSYAPGSFSRFQELSVIKDQVMIPRAELMFTEMLDDNQKMIDLLNICFDQATQEKQEAIANFLAERLDAHGKHGWMMKSILKKNRG